MNYRIENELTIILFYTRPLESRTRAHARTAVAVYV